MALHLVRHAEAELDAGPDPGLSPRGVEQATRLAMQLRRLGVERILHSPARRALDTAKLLSSQLGQLPVTQSDAIRDRTPVPTGDDRVYPPHALSWLSSTPVEERDPGGRELDTACTELLAGIGRHMAVVTHAYVIAWMTARVLNAPESAWLRLPVANASVTTVERNRHGELVLVRFNERVP